MNKLIRITKKFMLGLIIIAVCLFTFIASPTSPLKNQTNKVAEQNNKIQDTKENENQGQ